MKMNIMIDVTPITNAVFLSIGLIVVICVICLIADLKRRR